MRLRNAITTLLLLFAGASLAYVAAGGGGPRAVPATAPSKAATTASMEADPARLLPHPATVTVYYFHATARCQTCRAIEANANEALHDAFAQQLADGTLAWRPLNVEAKENRHFIDDFQLTSRDIVVVRRRPDGSREWHRLDRTWALAHDKAAFVDYVEGEVSAALSGAAG